MRRDIDWGLIFVVTLLSFLLATMVFGVFYLDHKISIATKLCLDAGYQYETSFLSGEVYCVRFVDGSTESRMFMRD